MVAAWWWSAAWAATLRVGAGQAYTTVGAAADAAGPGDVVEIEPGVYDEALTLVDPDLTLTALGAVTWTGRDEVLLDVIGGRLTLLGVSFRPDGGRAITASGARVDVFNVDVRDNQGGWDGAAIAAVDGATVTLTDCTFADNEADLGGHVLIRDATLTATTSTFRGGRARDGGAFALADGAALTVEGGALTDHAATGSGGVFHVGHGDLDVRDATITGASAGSRGGVLRWSDTAPRGAARFEGVVLREASARTDGGVFSVLDAGALTLDGCTVTDSSTQGSGGVVSADGAASVTVHRSAVCSSVASNRGGVVRAVDVGELVIAASTFVRSGAAWGGVVHAQGAGDARVSHAHVLDSIATRGGGALYVDGPTLRLRSSLIAWTLGGHGVEVAAGAVDLDHNAFFANTPADVAPGVAPGRVVAGDPLLRDYRRNDRCDDDLLQLRVASPLVDAGEPGTTDPDGTPADIGAYGGPEAAAAWFADGDVDGVRWLYDCDDGDATVRPGAVERCDGLDNDCDGAVDSPSPPGAPTWYRDVDGDGYGDDATALTACEAPPRFVDLGGDCDDDDDEVFPLSPEICDGKDNDCDGSADGADAADQLTWYRDADGDGFGAPSSTVGACDAPDGYALSASDCDDADPDVNPVADERCDDVDNNCDGRIDGDDAVDRLPWYADADGDGWGVAGPGTVAACDAVPGLSRYDSDCDDADPSTHPYADEPCDPPEDRNCDGSVGDADLDEDGVRACEDCVDTDPLVYPGAPETWYDGLIQDCDAASDFDQDGDGVESADYGGADCDDTAPAVYPAAPEIPGNGVDEDCDGVDADAPPDDPDGCGCAQARPPSGGVVAAALLAGLARRRRR